MGKSLAAFQKSYLSIHEFFFVKNAKICFFEEEWFEWSFISNLISVGNKWV